MLNLFDHPGIHGNPFATWDLAKTVNINEAMGTPETGEATATSTALDST